VQSDRVREGKKLWEGGYKYLGSYVLNVKHDFSERKRKAWAAAHGLKNIWRSSMADENKRDIFRAYVLSVYLYGAVAWVGNDAFWERVDSTATAMLRWCLGYRRAGEATLSNYELYGHLPSARSIVTERTLRLVGHLMRTHDGVPSCVGLPRERSERPMVSILRVVEDPLHWKGKARESRTERLQMSIVRMSSVGSTDLWSDALRHIRNIAHSRDRWRYLVAQAAYRAQQWRTRRRARNDEERATDAACRARQLRKEAAFFTALKERLAAERVPCEEPRATRPRKTQRQTVDPCVPLAPRPLEDPRHQDAAPPQSLPSPPVPPPDPLRRVTRSMTKCGVPLFNKTIQQVQEEAKPLKRRRKECDPTKADSNGGHPPN
jgi:hypothetical protein